MFDPAPVEPRSPRPASAQTFPLPSAHLEQQTAETMEHYFAFSAPAPLTTRHKRNHLKSCDRTSLSRVSPATTYSAPPSRALFMTLHTPSSPDNLQTTPPEDSEEPPHQPESKPRSSKKLPIVAVVGRPNVGKSTLVNRLAGAFRSGAIVEDVVGITRDRTYRNAFWNGHNYRIVDTGGLVFDDDTTFLPDIRAQALVAIKESSAIILCVDGQAGVNPLDLQLVSFLRREVDTRRSPVFIAVNKCESDKGMFLAMDFWELGMGEPFPLSAIHGSGTGDLLDRLVEVLPLVEEEENDNVINVAIVGRPNVGKSSLLNVLTGKTRAIVSELPGTTRDAVDEIIVANGREYRLIDTAGIRRKTNVKFGTEFFMINRAFKSIRRADVVLLMLDVSEESEQDRKIADRIKDEGKGCVVLANKWDLIPEKNDRSYPDFIDTVRERTVSIPWAQVELVSVHERQRLSKILSLVDDALEQHRRRVSTAVLNEVLREAVDWHRPPSTRAAKQGRIYYCTQVASRPPTIAMFVNEPRLFHDNYRRYMEGQFRKALGLAGTPLRIVWRGKARAPSLA